MSGIFNAGDERVPSATRRAVARFRRQRADYYEYLAEMLEASKGEIKILQLFERDAERFPNDARGVLCTYWAQRYAENGSNLADTFDDTLPEDEVAIVRIAQDAGDGALLAALKDLARVARLGDRVSSSVKAVLAAGVIGLALAAMVLTIFPVFAVFKMQDLFGMVPVEHWGPIAKSFVAHAERVKSYGLYAVAMCVGLALWISWTVTNVIGPTRDWLDNRVVLYRTYRDIKGALFLAMMATLTRRRGNTMFTLRQSIETFVLSARSPWLKWRVQEIVDRIDATGGTDSEVFNTNLLSASMFYYLRDLQEARGFAEGFEATGKYVESKVVANVVTRMLIYRCLLLLVGVAAVIGVIGWQFAVIYEMNSTMQLYMSTR